MGWPIPIQYLTTTSRSAGGAKVFTYSTRRRRGLTSIGPRVTWRSWASSREAPARRIHLQATSTLTPNREQSQTKRKSSFDSRSRPAPKRIEYSFSNHAPDSVLADQPGYGYEPQRKRYCFNCPLARI